MSTGNQPSKNDEIEYVGAPTEFADAEEVPDWVAPLAKLIVAVPALLATLSMVQLVLIGVVLVCLACVALVVFAL